MPKKVLIVTKDVMEFKLYHSVAEMLKKQSVDIIVVAEGLSMDMWIKAGWEIYQGLPKEGNFDLNTKIRSDIDVSDTIIRCRPDVVLTGLGAPIHLGEEFGFGANRLSTTLGFVEDLWFSHRRSSAFPNFICTPDGYGRQAIEAWPRYTGQMPRVFVTGSSAMDTLQDVKPFVPLANIIEKERACGREFTRVILVGGQSEPTTPMLQGLKEASLIAASHGERWLIIPRFHPKWMADATKAAFKSEWERIVFEMEEYHRVLWVPLSVDTRTLVPLATEVVSIFSNLLIEAVGLGTLAVSWTSEVGRQKMAESFGGASKFPLAELGACLEVSSAQEFLNLPHPRYYGSEEETTPFFTEKAKRILGLDGKATQRVVDAVLEYLD